MSQVLILLLICLMWLTRMSGIGSIFAAQPPAEPAPRASYAAADPISLGGGFLEMLFRGPAGLAPQRPYQPDTAPTDPRYQQSRAVDPALEDDPSPAEPEEIQAITLRPYTAETS